MDTRVTILGARNSYLNQIVYELRDQGIQQDRLRFRTNLERVGEILAYELSKELEYEEQEVITPLGSLNMSLLKDQPVLVSILRAGIPFHQGFLRIFDRSDNGFVSAYRHHTKGNDFIVRVEYASVPELTNRSLILLDPMIATGKSMVLAYKEIVEIAAPAQLFLCGVIAAEEGLEYVLRQLPTARIFVAAVDNELTAKSYIVPGLGDAGDLAYGKKS